MEAAVATRIVQIEEGLSKTPILQSSPFNKSSEVGEQHRIGPFSIIEESSNIEPCHLVQIQFSQLLVASKEDKAGDIDGKRWRTWQEELVVG
jgi:hypothetical protein